jgi:hypothetical protein
MSEGFYLMKTANQALVGGRGGGHAGGAGGGGAGEEERSEAVQALVVALARFTTT